MDEGMQEQCPELVPIFDPAGMWVFHAGKGDGEAREGSDSLYGIVAERLAVRAAKIGKMVCGWIQDLVDDVNARLDGARHAAELVDRLLHDLMKGSVANSAGHSRETAATLRLEIRGESSAHPRNSILAAGHPTPDDRPPARSIVPISDAPGGSDNITVVVAKFREAEEHLKRSEAATALEGGHDLDELAQPVSMSPTGITDGEKHSRVPQGGNTT